LILEDGGPFDASGGGVVVDLGAGCGQCGLSPRSRSLNGPRLGRHSAILGSD
jgi:hypothetical protein